MKAKRKSRRRGPRRTRHLTFEALEEKRLLAVTATDVAVDGNQELKVFDNGEQAAVIVRDPAKSVVFRANDRFDINGWGSSLFLVPFIRGGDSTGGALTSFSVVDDVVHITASGAIGGPNGGEGVFAMTGEIRVGSSPEQAVLTASLRIDLNDTLANLDDLNLGRLSSNILHDVPSLYGPGNVTTGDILNDVTFRFSDAANATIHHWTPTTTPGHFPSGADEKGSYIKIETTGVINEVDTEAQGRVDGNGQPVAIAAARKPSLSWEIRSRTAGVELVFGGIFTTSEATLFEKDNIGVTPLIKKGSTGETTMIFDVEAKFNPGPQSGWRNGWRGDGADPLDINNSGAVGASDILSAVQAIIDNGLSARLPAPDPSGVFFVDFNNDRLISLADLLGIVDGVADRILPNGEGERRAAPATGAAAQLNFVFPAAEQFDRRDGLEKDATDYFDHARSLATYVSEETLDDLVPAHTAGR